jgi:CheY-like chemotaxis protein
MQSVIAIVDDLFFASKIRGTAEQVGTRVQFSRSIPDAVAKSRDEAPALIIADLNAGCCDVLELARALKGDDALSAVPLLGFFSHIQTELQQAAVEAGYDRVMPRSAFTKNLAQILTGES